LVHKAGLDKVIRPVRDKVVKGSDERRRIVDGPLEVAAHEDGEE